MSRVSTELLTVRITRTQRALLRTPKYYAKTSAIVRVLISLYLNGHLAALNVEDAIQKEIENGFNRQKTSVKKSI